MKAFALFATAAALALAAGTASAATDAAPAAAAPAASAAVDIVRPATDLPPPITRRTPAVVKVNLETKEILGKLADGTTFKYWTYNSKLPGPMVRVRVGDTVEVTLHNPADSSAQHNVDFHAVTGPGGGASATLAAPGETRSFTFKALQPGLYIYHCAAPTVAQHIANGMYGAILVEPAEGLPKVDREFYVVQGEIYTEEPMGTQGEATESIQKLLDEQPEYYVMNGAYKALTGDKALKAKVGETVRIYFGVGGPNKTSSFHVIGEIFDNVYQMASLTSPPIKDVQTVTVAPGGATVVDFKLEVPGNYILVDHALSRVERGGAGILTVTGPENPEIFRAAPNPNKDMGH
ncbi:copper-containing nitrite reductase [Phenylobacterium sp.]|uniref:copper-containing nitrite reductase n=1 Tax=Phenylobacterium sp. TaxID=1871053 RepID=UPI002C061BB4|nr:copper-containing nitrite reductase [Phenylobacterium sp.]HVI33488.1 copper-containing nitrite reductase [Phenylobacterium sp.]